MPRVTVVRCSARLPADQLTWQAWQALHRGPVVVDAAAPHLTAVGICFAVRLAVGDDVWLTSRADAEQELTARGLAHRTVVGSIDPPGAVLLDVVAVMDRLRSAGGCPWDAKQTHTSLMPYLLEEAYETYEALENADLSHLREELGDLLLQIAFHARIAEEFDIDDVSRDLVDKLVRRHPHVFDGAPADDLEGSWEELKAAEKGRVSVTEGIPIGQPALMLAAKLQRRAATLGAPFLPFPGLGGQLWEVVNRCASSDLDPEVALRTVAPAFRDRLAALEATGDLPSSPDQWSQRWS